MALTGRVVLALTIFKHLNMCVNFVSCCLSVSCFFVAPHGIRSWHSLCFSTVQRAVVPHSKLRLHLGLAAACQP